MKQPTTFRANRVLSGLGDTLVPDTLQLDSSTLFYGLTALAVGMFFLGGRVEPQRRVREGQRKRYEEKARHYREKAQKYA